MRKISVGVVLGCAAVAGLSMAGPAYAEQVGCGLLTGGYATPCVQGDASGGSAGVTSSGAPLGGGIVLSGQTSGTGSLWVGGSTSNPPPLDSQVIVAASPDGVSVQCSQGGGALADCAP